ncbi:hypothetical protein BDZ45DRAFT_737248 [Acephala macrosclerotiorum]|nr:hypothetical protein BDZ45DRAFT_737248 [Acephala macrosclerotiorum]
MGDDEPGQHKHHQQRSTWAFDAKLAAYELVGYYVGNNKYLFSISNDTPNLANEEFKTWPIPPPYIPTDYGYPRWTERWPEQASTERPARTTSIWTMESLTQVGKREFCDKNDHVNDKLLILISSSKTRHTLRLYSPQSPKTLISRKASMEFLGAELESPTPCNVLLRALAIPQASVVHWAPSLTRSSVVQVRVLATKLDAHLLTMFGTMALTMAFYQPMATKTC